MTADRLDVMCCCEPENVLGTLPVDAPFPVREWEDTEGNSGVAFAAHGSDISSHPDFSPSARGKKKPPRRTWKEKRSPKGSRSFTF